MDNKPLDELVICTIKNIADFDFTPELGAMYGGRSFFVKSGEELQAPEPAAYRLAVNLAKAILVSKMPAPTYGSGDDRSAMGVWGDDDVKKLVEQITISTSRQEKQKELSHDERIAKQIEELNAWRKSVEESTPVKESVGFQDKAEVIAELEKNGIKFDRRKSKTELEKLLNVAE